MHNILSLLPWWILCWLSNSFSLQNSIQFILFEEKMIGRKWGSKRGRSPFLGGSQGVSNYFCSGARLKTAGVQRFEAKGFHWCAKHRKEEGGGGSHPLPQVGVRRISPEKILENCLKMVHSGVFWSSYCKFQNRKFIWTNLRLYVKTSY